MIVLGYPLKCHVLRALPPWCGTIKTWQRLQEVEPCRRLLEHLGVPGKGIRMVATLSLLFASVG